MKTIGKVIHEARTRKRYSLAKVEEKTKIKGSFLNAIEKENWEVLPEFPVVTGFVKSISEIVGIPVKTATALLRRDYPPKPLSINPKPDVGGKFIWSPKLTFLAGVGLVIIVILGYLGFQYLKFLSPPSLAVYKPKDRQVVESRDVEVSGKTDSDATVTVNNQLIIIDQEGKFDTTIQIFEGTKEIIVKATSRGGRESTISRKIVPKLK